MLSRIGLLTRTRTQANSSIIQMISLRFNSAPAVESKAKSSDSATKNTMSSSCPEGTVLSGLNLLKNGKDPVAFSDDKYPEWLFELANQPTSLDQLPFKKHVQRLRNKHIKEVNFQMKKK
ncbi:hypothetical protein MP638_004480 [Amoeboaphelidium occidentale]|nr:hypothetical protein MP638_004480 [Amoeboaphelidium occidentale]